MADQAFPRFVNAVGAAAHRVTAARLALGAVVLLGGWGLAGLDAAPRNRARLAPQFAESPLAASVAIGQLPATAPCYTLLGDGRAIPLAARSGRTDGARYAGEERGDGRSAFRYRQFAAGLPSGGLFSLSRQTVAWVGTKPHAARVLLQTNPGQSKWIIGVFVTMPPHAPPSAPGPERGNGSWPPGI